MVVDSSAVVAIALEEADAAIFVGAIVDAAVARISAGNLIEAAIVLDMRGNEGAQAAFDALRAKLPLRIEPVTERHFHLAREAYRRYGKGRHKAALNFGDCFAYALAKATGEPLLFKGDDFIHTDVRPAIR